MADTEKKGSAIKAEKPKGFSAFLKKTGKFFRDCKGEMKKIVWPTKEAVFKNFGVVLVVILVATVFVSGIDFLFLNLLKLVMNVAGV